VIFDADQGVNFGTWDDPVSRLMYGHSTPIFLDMVDYSGSVYDLGGGNGLLKQYIPHSISVDIDQNKQPDVIQDIRQFSTKCDLVVIRYVLHYFSDKDVVNLITHIKEHAKKVMVIQFCNEGVHLKVKRQISKQSDERKYFRNSNHLFRLLSRPIDIRSVSYTVTPVFYENRLKINVNCSHSETVFGIVL